MTDHADGENLIRRLRDFDQRPIEAEGLIIYCIEEMNLVLGWPVAHVFACLGQELFSTPQRSFWRVHPQYGTAAGRLDTLRTAWPGSKLSPRSGVPWLAYSGREAVWIPDVGAYPGADPQGLLAGAGLRAALAVPIVTPDRVLGVLEWFHGEPRDEDIRLTAVSGVLGREVGRLLETRENTRSKAA